MVRGQRLRRWLVLPLLLMIASAAAYVWADTWYHSSLAALRAPVIIEITAGEPLARVARRLHADPAVGLEHPRLWAWVAQWQGRAAHVRAGEYALSPGLSPAALLEQLVEGRVLLHPVTLVDGWTFLNTRAALDGNSVLRHELPGLSDADLVARIGIDAASVEGEFYPETYLVARGTSDLEVLRLAHDRLVSRLAAVWAQRRREIPIHSPYELLIMASLIEKETAEPSERPRIAAVFMNRLRQGMRLQTDPTVIYGLGTRYEGSLHRKDLITDTAYNTYTRAGLPPTPIATPSDAALLAAAQPADSDDLYFVASGHGDGKHVFSKTLSAHQEAVQHYLHEKRAGSRHP